MDRLLEEILADIGEQGGDACPYGASVRRRLTQIQDFREEVAEVFSILAVIARHIQRRLPTYVSNRDVGTEVVKQLGNTPLHDTIEADIEDVYAYGDRPKFRVAKLLHDLGADVTVRNVRGQTPLDVVGNYGQDAEYFRNVLAEVLDLR